MKKASGYTLFIIIATVLGAWLWQLYFAHQWQSRLTSNFMLPEPVEAQVSEMQPETSVVLANVTLPPPPKRALPRKMQAIQSSSASVERLSANTKKTELAPNRESKNIRTTPNSETSSKTPTDLARDTQQVYEQLSDDTTLDIQLAWPAKLAERNRVIDFLYSCMGAQFATLQGQSLTYLSPNRYNNASNWLRIAQGALSDTEQRWFSQHQYEGTPIRIFPHTIDWQLSEHIAQALGSQKLEQLRASYGLSGNRLVLRDVYLNGRLVPDTWYLGGPSCRL